MLPKMLNLPESEKMVRCTENRIYRAQHRGFPLKKFFNTSGLLYKEMKLKDKLPAMSEEEQLQLLATNGMLVKRPLLIDGDTVLIGFKEAEWSEKLG